MNNQEQLLALRNGLVELESGSNTLYSSSIYKKKCQALQFL